MNGTILIIAASLLIAYILYKAVMIVVRLVTSTIKRQIQYKLMAILLSLGTSGYYSSSAFIFSSLRDFENGASSELVSNASLPELKESYLNSFGEYRPVYEFMAALHSDRIEKSLGLLQINSPDVPNMLKKETYLKVSHLLGSAEGERVADKVLKAE